MSPRMLRRVRPGSLFQIMRLAAARGVAAGEQRVWLPAELSPEEARLKDELMHSLVNPELAHELRGYVEDCFRRLLTTLELVPPKEGRVLELGANPYFFTLLLKRSRRYELELANFFGSHGQNSQRIV